MIPRHFSNTTSGFVLPRELFLWHIIQKIFNKVPHIISHLMKYTTTHKIRPSILHTYTNFSTTKQHRPPLNWQSSPSSPSSSSPTGNRKSAVSRALHFSGEKTAAQKLKCITTMHSLCVCVCTENGATRHTLLQPYNRRRRYALMCDRVLSLHAYSFCVCVYVVPYDDYISAHAWAAARRCVRRNALVVVPPPLTMRQRIHFAHSHSTQSDTHAQMHLPPYIRTCIRRHVSSFCGWESESVSNTKTQRRRQKVRTDTQKNRYHHRVRCVRPDERCGPLPILHW